MQAQYSFEYEDMAQNSFVPFKFKDHFEGAVLSQRGGRDENQDAWSFGHADDDSCFFCVADGLGGHAGGRIAAHLVVRSVFEACRANAFAMAGEALQRVVEAAQAAIIEAREKDSSHKTMRSTMMLLLVKQNKAIWCHIGDVRLYHVRNGVILNRTKDQSVPQMLVDAGEITADKIRNHPDRNRLLQSLGHTDGVLRPAYRKEPVSLEAGDGFIMASDGFWEWLQDEELAALCMRASSKEALVEADAELKKRASPHELQFDNYTALLLRIGQGVRKKRLVSRILHKLT